MWLIEHQPQSEILSSPFGRLESGAVTAEDEKAAASGWEDALAAHPSDARVFWNAAQFFRERNHEASLRFMRAAAELAPGNWYYGFGLGERYGWQLMMALRAGNPAGASAVPRELEATKNPAVLEPAIMMLQGEYNKSLMMGPEQRAYRDKAEHLFARLAVLNPDVDRARVMPRFDPAPKPAGPRPAEAIRLQVADFPRLPSAVATALRTRKCTIPQPRKDGPRRNAIQGEFFRRGQRGWAVVCSSAGKSSILVFQSDGDTEPEEIAKSEDGFYLMDTGQGWTSYSREISAVDRSYIVRHYRAYGGPPPPPIDHHGVDDGFLEKASVTWYRHNGKWMPLQGAD